MTITGGSALPKDDIERMMRDAQDHADEDRQRREDAETRNLAEALQWQTEKFLAENGDKLPQSAKDEINEALVDLRGALGGTDIERIKYARTRSWRRRRRRPARCSTARSRGGGRRRRRRAARRAVPAPAAGR